MLEIKRLRKVLNWLYYNEYADNDSDFAQKIGYTKSSFSQIINGKVPLSDKFLNKLCSLNENINKVWILTGSGSMLKDEKNDSKRDETNANVELMALELKYLKEKDSLRNEIDRLNKEQEELRKKNNHLEKKLRANNIVVDAQSELMEF